MVQLLCKQGSYEELFTLLGEMKRRRFVLNPQSRKLLCTLLAKQPLFEAHTQKLYQYILTDDARRNRQQVWDEIMQHLVAQASKHENALRHVENCVKKLEKECRTIDTMVYFRFLYAAATHGDLKLAQSTLEGLVETPGKISKDLLGAYNWTLHGLANVENHPEVVFFARRLLREMREKDLAPDARTCTDMMEILTNSGQTEEADELFEVMKQQDMVSVVQYNNKLRALARSGAATTEVMAVVEEMRSQDLTPDRTTYVRILEALGRKDDGRGIEQEAGGVIELMFEEGMSRHDCNRLIGVLSRHTDSARRVADVVEQMEPNLESFVHLFTAQSRLARKDVTAVDKARKVLDKLRKEGPTPNLFVYTAYLNVLANGIVQDRGLLGEMETVFNEMQTVGVKPSLFTMNTLLTGIARAAATSPGLLERAWVYMDLLEDLNIKPNTVTLNTLLHGLAMVAAREYDAFERAEKLIAELSQYGVQPDVVSYNSLLHCLARSKATPDTLNSGRQLLGQMKAKGLAPTERTVGSLAHLFGKSMQRHPDAKATAGFLKKMQQYQPLWNNYSVAWMMRGLTAVGKGSEALALFAEARSRGLVPDTMAYNAAIEAHGTTQETMAVAEEMRAAGVQQDEVTARLIERAVNTTD